MWKKILDKLKTKKSAQLIKVNPTDSLGPCNDSQPTTSYAASSHGNLEMETSRVGVEGSIKRMPPPTPHRRDVV